NGDGGWGWFPGHGEKSYPHTTAVVVHGLLTGKAAGTAIDGKMLTAGLNWLTAYEKDEVQALERYDERQKKIKAGIEPGPAKAPEKSKAGALDAFVRQILGGASVENPAMLAFLYRDRVDLPVYGQALLGLELHRLKDMARRDEIL